MEQNIIIGASLFVGLLNLIVSIKVGRSDYLDVFQKVMQMLLIWLIPVFGALGIWAFVRTMDDPVQANKPEFGGGSTSRGDEYAGMD